MENNFGQIKCLKKAFKTGVRKLKIEIVPIFKHKFTAVVELMKIYDIEKQV